MTKRTYSLLLVASITLTILLSGCTAAVVGVTTGAAAVHHDRRSTGIMIDDQETELRAYNLLNNHPDIAERSNISVTSYNLVVLMTGQAENNQVVARYADLISRLPRVKKVHNQVKIGAQDTLSGATSDTYITSKVKVALFKVDLPDFDATRVKVVTSQGTVYLMGLVTRAEANAATEKVRYVSGVKHVVKVFEYLD